MASLSLSLSLSVSVCPSCPLPPSPFLFFLFSMAEGFFFMVTAFVFDGLGKAATAMCVFGRLGLVVGNLEVVRHSDTLGDVPTYIQVPPPSCEVCCEHSRGRQSGQGKVLHLSVSCLLACLLSCWRIQGRLIDRSID